MSPNVLLVIIVAIILFICYLIFDFASTNLNSFLDRWAKKTLWIWLPFYGFQRLIKEIFFRKK